MNDLRSDFLRALAKDEDDTKVRLTYADWLDEQGEHEEAERQRKWPGAKQWLVAFCQEHNPRSEFGGAPISYEQLIERGLMAVAEPNDEGELWIGCGDNEVMCDALRMHAREFWMNWSIITGLPVASDAETKTYFSCGC